MYENLKSATVYTPKNFLELRNIKKTSPHAIYWAGGSYLMTKEKNDNPENPREIISLDHIEELKKITRTDTFLEVGSMVSLDEFSITCKTFFPEEITEAINSIGTQIIRRQATIGGALCTKKIKTSIIAILYCMEAQVEIRIQRKKRFISRWINISNLYDKNGNLSINENSLIVKIKLTMQKDKHYFFKTIDNPMLSPETTTIFGIGNLIPINNLLSSRMIVIYPSLGFHIPDEITTQLANQYIPINPQRIHKLVIDFGSSIKAHFPSISLLQLEQSKRLFEYYLYHLNRSYLELITVHDKKKENEN